MSPLFIEKSMYSINDLKMYRILIYFNKLLTLNPISSEYRQWKLFFFCRYSCVERTYQTAPSMSYLALQQSVMKFLKVNRMREKFDGGRDAMSRLKRLERTQRSVVAGFSLLQREHHLSRSRSVEECFRHSLCGGEGRPSVFPDICCRYCPPFQSTLTHIHRPA